MVKKAIIFFATLMVSVVCVDAFAVPSVRHLGNNVSTNTTINTEKNVTVLPSLPKANSEVVRSVKTQTVKESDDPARISIGSFRFKQLTPGENQSGGSAGSVTGNGGSSNAITGVIEKESGNYVTGLSVGSGNKLEVTKSRVLVAPVFQGNSDTGSNAEIWVVK